MPLLTFRVLLAFCNVGVGLSIILEDRVWWHSRCHLLSIHSQVFEVVMYMCSMHACVSSRGDVEFVVRGIYRVCVYAPMVSWKDQSSSSRVLNKVYYCFGGLLSSIYMGLCWGVK